MMSATSPVSPFSQEFLDFLFPQERANRFFDAMFGDASEGAYDIALTFAGERDHHLHFEFRLTQRPGRCLACHLTYGLPDVFQRHPVIDLAGLVRQIDTRLTDGRRCGRWQLGRTRELSRTMHVIPLTIALVPDGSV